MNIDLASLIEALRRALDSAVAPELQSDFARGQLAAVHDILGKLAGMVVWDPQAQQSQALVLRAGCERFAACAARAGVPLPGGAAAADLPAVQARARQLIDWLDEAGPSLPAALAAELGAILRGALREQLRIERKRIPLTDFSAMTSGAVNETKEKD